MREYTYDGPVVRFGVCIQSTWKAKTVASSEAKARSNLAYRFKKEMGLLPSASISLPGKITST